MLQWGLTLLCGLVVFLFWRYRYPFVLAYQEQLQLFLFDDDYLVGRLTEPGGFARYVAEFLTQFYNGVTFGALILAVVYMLIQRLTWQLMRSVSRGTEPTVLYPLSFIPTVMLWYAMGDESVLLMYAVALVMALAAAVGWIRWAYYGYDEEEVPIPEQSGGGGGGSDMSPEDVQQMIDDALNGITITQKDEDTTEIDINGNKTDIDDIYLTNVERDDETNEVVFNLNNGKDPIRVSVDELDNPNIDGSTF